ncbi:MAG: DUF547 domain-containing protein [Verrucomicrobiales bacterium]|nr:DUF547 domain-containing protein [Verrucomicrobiaceae bacterium]
MKATLIILATLSFVARAEDAKPTTWVDQYEALLQKHVTAQGVNYAAWNASAADKKQLATVISAIGKEHLSGKSKDAQLAFYLNAYNAHILDQILKEYPTDGPGGGGLFGRNKFFKRSNLLVAGKKTSFTALENDVIRPTFKEPRIHFALNCASASCPPLHPEAFRGSSLDATLTALTKAFVSKNPKGVKPIGWKKVAISKIFDWYEEDFKAAGGALAYINQYRNTKLSKGTKVSFQSYSWKLNATPNK